MCLRSLIHKSVLIIVVTVNTAGCHLISGWFIGSLLSFIFPALFIQFIAATHVSHSYMPFILLSTFYSYLEPSLSHYC